MSILKKINSLRVWWIITIISMATIFLHQPANNGNGVIHWDITQYYIYLPATFIYQDLKQEKDWNYRLIDHNIGLIPGSCFKMTSGVAILYTPFFLTAHAVALAHPDFEPNGFSRPYQLALSIGSVFFILLGLWFLRKFLILYCSEKATSITLVLIYFGTNLLYFTLWKGPMSHGYSFTMMCLLLYLSEKYIRNQTLTISFIIGLSAGLICLIRPVNVIICLPVFLYLIVRLIQQKKPIKISNIVLIIIGGCLAVSPQFFYWKYVTGDWIYYSYGNESFFFDNPQIINGLFSYRKGWLIYTPIMIFSLLGFIPLFKKNRTYFFSVFPLFAVFVFVTFSWWCWWYGGSFGQRAMIESYPLLALPMAYLIQWIVENKSKLKYIAAPVFGFLIYLNIFQSIQSKNNILHFDSMTKETYWLIFLKGHHPPGLSESLDHPDYEKAMQGIYE